MTYPHNISKGRPGRVAKHGLEETFKERDKVGEAHYSYHHVHEAISVLPALETEKIQTNIIKHSTEYHLVTATKLNLIILVRFSCCAHIFAYIQVSFKHAGMTKLFYLNL